MSKHKDNPVLRMAKRALGFRTGGSDRCSGTQETIAVDEQQIPERGSRCGDTPAQKDNPKGA